MDKHQVRIAVICALLLLGALACGDTTEESAGEDPVVNNDDGNNDTDNNEVGNNDTDNNDVPPNNDAPNNDAPNNDMICDVDAEIASLVGELDTVTAGDFAMEAGEDGSIFTLDASVGGNANAGTSSYIYVDLDTGERLEISDVEALSNSDWDLAFKRSIIRLNGGDSGPSALMLSSVSETTWEDATPPGADAMWAVDDFMDDECNLVTVGPGLLNTAFGAWYDYDPSTHTVSNRPGEVYFIYNAATHMVTQLEIQDYADGTYTIRWKSAF